MSLLDGEFDINRTPKLITIGMWLHRNRLYLAIVFMLLFVVTIIIAANRPQQPVVFEPKVTVSFKDEIKTETQTHTVPTYDSRNVQFVVLVDKDVSRDATYRYLESEVNHKHLYDVKNEIESIVSSLVAKNIIVQKIIFLPKSDL